MWSAILILFKNNRSALCATVLLLIKRRFKNAGKKEDALRGYLQMLTINPNSYQAANNAGVTLIELKDYQLAEKYLTKAIELNPNSEIPYNNLGIVYLHLQNYSKMENNFNMALKLKNNYVHAINNQVIARIHKDILNSPPPPNKNDRNFRNRH